MLNAAAIQAVQAYSEKIEDVIERCDRQVVKQLTEQRQFLVESAATEEGKKNGGSSGINTTILIYEMEKW